MPRSIKLSDELISAATTTGKALHRSPPRQIEYWARIGKIAEENPDLPLGLVRDILDGIHPSIMNRNQAMSVSFRVGIGSLLTSQQMYIQCIYD